MAITLSHEQWPVSAVISRLNLKSYKNLLRTGIIPTMRKRKKALVKNKQTFNPHRYLVSAARREWRWSPEHKEAALNCAVGTTRRTCVTCKETFPRKQVHIDHISPVGKQPRDWDEYPAYYRRLFCPVSNLNGVCVPCHKIKSAKENKERKASA
jgi:5-methylcytosine-specific restriction endonuclease McrA